MIVYNYREPCHMGSDRTRFQTQDTRQGGKEFMLEPVMAVQLWKGVRQFTRQNINLDLWLTSSSPRENRHKITELRNSIEKKIFIKVTDSRGSRLLSQGFCLSVWCSKATKRMKNVT